MSRFAPVIPLSTWKEEARLEGRLGRGKRRKGKRRGERAPERAPERGPQRGQAARGPGRPPGRPADPWADSPQSPDLLVEPLPEDDDPAPDGELGATRQRLGRVRDALSPGWGPHVALGPNVRVQAREGFRVGVVEVKPGLFVLAEVPERSVEFGLGPLLLAPALVKTLGRAMQGSTGHRASVQQQSASRPLLPWRQPAALPAPPERLARWLDDDIAAELGCAACERERA